MSFFEEPKPLTQQQIQQAREKREARKMKMKELRERVENQAETGLLSGLKFEIKLPMKKDKRQAYIEGLINATPDSHKKRLQCLQMALSICKTNKQYSDTYKVIKNHWNDRKLCCVDEGNQEEQAKAEKKEAQAKEKHEHYRDLYEQGDEKENEKKPLLDKVYDRADEIDAQINKGCTECFAKIKKCFGF